MRDGNYAYLTILFSHGLTAALTLYLAVQGGNWIDRRLGTSPLFLIILIILVVGANLRLLVKDILAELEKQDRPPRGGSSGRAPRWRGPGQAKEGQDREEEDE